MSHDLDKTISEIQRLEDINYATATQQVRNYQLADYTHEVIMKRIKEFEAQLDDDHETAVQLSSFGRAVTMVVASIGFSNPSTLVFHGYVDGRRATLIQHMTQLNFLLLAVEKPDPKKPPHRIGFALPNED